MAGLVINTDSGWHKATVDGIDYLYKGYADADRLENLLPQIAQQSQPKFTGNFCVFVDQVDCVLVRTSCYRSFPVWYDADSFTNLKPCANSIWSDSQCDVQSSMQIRQKNFVEFTANIETTNDSAIDSLDKILTQKTQQLKQQLDRPIRVFLSGGVDTMLMYSYILREQVPHQLIQYLHIEYDDFYLSNSADICRNWSYNQIHHWREPCMLVSGAPGDEYFLRSPTTANILLRWHGTTINQQLEQWPSCMHASYFKSAKHQELFEQQAQENLQFDTKQDLNYFLLNWLHNDWQHHHLGNTLTWTPFRDLKLLKIMLSMPYEDQLTQIMDSKISCALIERNVPGLSKYLSTQKNHGNFMSNLKNLYKSIG
jgi:hypothetical protein